MTTKPLEAHRKWRDELIYHLRMKDIPGDRIGDILLEVESHIGETGETPAEAFGDAKHYAATHAEATPPPPEERTTSNAGLILIGVSSFVGAGLYASGAIAIGKGEDAYLGLDGWVALVLGLALVTFTIIRLPSDLIRHPETGELLFGGTTKIKAITFAFMIALGLVFFGLGLLLS